MKKGVVPLLFTTISRDLLARDENTCCVDAPHHPAFSTLRRCAAARRSARDMRLTLAMALGFSAGCSGGAATVLMPWAAPCAISRLAPLSSPLALGRKW